MALVGAPRGDPLRGRALSIVVVAEASDGYRAAFTLADLDSAFRKASITLADHIQDVMDPAQAQLIEMKGFT
jgi:hypothetical protein